MNPNLGLPVKPIRRPTETSQWIPPSDSGSPLQNWRHSAHNIEQTQDLTSIAGNVNRSLAALPSTVAIDYNMHPFKVYSFPFAMYGDDPDYLAFLSSVYGITDPWRVLTIRTGLFIEGQYSINCTGYYTDPTTTDVTLSSAGLPGLCLSMDSVGLMNGDILDSSFSGVIPNNPAGTSWASYNPAASILNGDGWFTAPEDAISWVWAEIYGYETDTFSGNYGGVTKVTLKCSADPASKGWENFPAWNPYIYPIATVDTKTYKEQKFPLVHQIRSDNIILDPNSMGCYGRITTTGSEMLSNYGGRGVPCRALVSNRGSSNKGLYMSRTWFNDLASPNFTDSTKWIKIADLT